MKKFSAIVLTLILASLTSCGTVGNADVTEQNNDIYEDIIEETTQEEPTEEITTEEVTEEDTEEQTEDEEEQTEEVTETPIEPTTVTDPIGYIAGEKYADSENFSVNEDGSVSLDNNAEETDEQSLIESAQALFEVAGATEWKFTVGCPYTLDETQTVQNEYGWDMYLITDPNINSLADVEADYYKVFSDRYPNSLYETFMESNGHVYCLNGERGSDIYYTGSKITSLDYQTDDEIFFTVTNYYSGTMFNDSEPHEESAEFSMVLGSDGLWRAGQFILPY